LKFVGPLVYNLQQQTKGKLWLNGLNILGYVLENVMP
jgi:hypothetical protein